MPLKATVRACSSSANLGPGFDALAVALDAFYDVVEARLEEGERGVWIDAVSGPYADLVPAEPNTAAAAVKELLNRLNLGEVGISLRIRKGIPPGRGLGSSGASAAAAVVAASRLLGVRAPVEVLVEAAGLGEAAVAGAPHYDNVAASLLGGLVAVATGSRGLRVVRLNVDAWFAVAVPKIGVPKAKTGIMRSVLPRHVELFKAVANWQRLAAMLAALAARDYRLAGEMMLGDEIVELARSRYVPCYNEVKRAALEAGAYGAALSGAGPSMIALAGDPKTAQHVAREMARAYSECGIKATAKASRVGEPATLIST
ncbi:MAG: homoserine kinase [Thermoproteota archaeon]